MMLLTASVAVVLRAVGPEMTRELLAERTPEQALLDFVRWAQCPFVVALGGAR